MAFSIYNCTNFPFQDLKVYNINNIYNPNYSIINIVNKIKYLGLMFDYNMKWDIHILNK